MKRIILIVLLFFANGLLQAQPWRCVVNGTHFFKNSAGLVQAIRIDSVRASGSDSVAYNFFTLNTSAPYDTCYNTQYPSWIGPKVLLRPTGENVFFNLNGDSIFIKTNAHPGHNFLFYRYSNGNYIEASVLFEYTANINQSLDSVKHFQLIVKNSMGTSISNTVSGSTFEISKQNGLIKSFEFLQFPDSLNAYNYFDYAIPPLYVFLEHNVGDIWSIYSHRFEQWGHENSWETDNYTVTNKSNSINNDTVIYLVSDQNIGDSYNYGVSSHSGHYSVITIEYPITLQKMTDNMPFQFIDSSNYSGFYKLYFDYNLNNRLIFDFKLTNTGYSTTGCLYQTGESFHRLVVQNVCAYYPTRFYNMVITYERDQSLKYFSNSLGIFGSPNNQDNENEFTFFPNPTTGKISISNLGKITGIQIHNVLGELIFRSTHEPVNPPTIDLIGNPAGIYFISLQTKEGMVTKKLVIE